MKKNILRIFLSTLMIISLVLITGCTNNLFKLEEKYYNNFNENNPFPEINEDNLKKLITDKESFAVFIYQPLCVNSADFEQVLHDFCSTNKITFYKLPFSKVKGTILEDKVKYYPSFVIFENGKIIDYLEADSDEDIDTYKSADGFSKWFSKYVDLSPSKTDPKKEETSSSNNQSTSQIVEENNKNVELNNIVAEENKVNIYLFWGNGCPHCEEEMKFLESIEKEYGKYFNLYKFETWYNEENVKLLEIFANAMGDSVTGVPYTIIGEETFSGFDKTMQEEIKEAIIKQSKNNFDVYLDKIKK